jgi:F0F1-type ATP synthase assembly protein I
MKLTLSVFLVLAAGALCGITIGWAVNAKLSPLIAIPFTLLLLVGLTAGALIVQKVQP